MSFEFVLVLCRAVYLLSEQIYIVQRCPDCIARWVETAKLVISDSKYSIVLVQRDFCKLTSSPLILGLYESSFPLYWVSLSNISGQKIRLKESIRRHSQQFLGSWGYLNTVLFDMLNYLNMCDSVVCFGSLNTFVFQRFNAQDNPKCTGRGQLY